MASPGLYWLGLDGTRREPLEDLPAQSMAISEGRVVAALREPEDTRRVQVRDLATGSVLWSSRAHGPVLGIDGDAVVSFDPGGEATPVLRDASTGEVRWRGAALPSEPASIWFAGPFVLVLHLAGMTAYRRQDGARLVDIARCSTAQFFDGRLYFGGLGFFACCAPELSA